MLTVRAGARSREEVSSAGGALATEVNPTGRAHLGVGCHGRVTAGAEQIKGQTANRTFYIVGQQIHTAARAGVFRF